MQGLERKPQVLGFGGEASGSKTADTEEYDGTSWSEQNNLSTAREALAGAGLQTAGLAFWWC